MTNTSFSSLLFSFMCLSLAACAATQAPAPTTPAPAPAPPATPPAGWTVLAGPHATLEAACHGCQLSPVKTLSGDFVAVAQGGRGLESVLALKTARGWYIEERERPQLRHSHHEPRSIFYDLERTRIADGAVVRMVDSLSVFYPGRGGAGSSSTTWYDRTCRVFGDVVACGRPVSIAKRRCTRSESEKKCTGTEP